MRSYLRHISTALTFVILFTSVINVVLNICMSEGDHYAIELIGHEESSGHSHESFSLETLQASHDVHPEDCLDTSLIDNTLIQRDVSLSSWDGEAPQFFLIDSILDSIPLVVIFEPQTQIIEPGSLSLRPPIQDLSTIKLLI